MNFVKLLSLGALSAFLFLEASLALAQNRELNYASTKDIRDVNPHLYMGEMAAQNMLFESLVINTPQGVKPHLAESWEVSPDGKVYTFKLREGVKFHDGEAFNAEAVKLNIEAVVNNRQRHAWMEMTNQIAKVEAPQEHTLVLTMSEVYYPVLVELGVVRPFRFISPKCFKDGETKNGVSCYAGTGPWVLDEHKKNQYAVFKVNNNYWGEKPRIPSVRWKVMPEHQTIIMALEKGDTDLVFGADGDMIDMDSFYAIEKEGRFSTLLSHPIASRALLLNTNKAITDDLAVRQALAHAIDREAIVSGILNGSETAAKTLLSTGTPYCNIDLKTYEYDMAKAADILEKNGWIIPEGKDIREKNSIPLEIIFSYNVNNASEKNIAEFIQGELQSIGVNLKLLGEEKQAFLDRQKTGEFGIQYSLSWGPPYDPQSYVSSFRTPAHADFQAQSGLKEKKDIDIMISRLLITPDEQERKELYAKVFGILADQSVYIPLSYSRTKAIHAKDLKGVSFNVSQYEIPFEKMYFE